MITDEFAILWNRADDSEKKAIREMIEEFFEKPSTKKLKPMAAEVLDFLNLKANRNYRHVDANLKPIVDRLKSGITVQQLKGVIAKKCREWTGSEMELCLRPATLFNKTKCEQYIGELGK